MISRFVGVFLSVRGILRKNFAPSVTRMGPQSSGPGKNWTTEKMNAWPQFFKLFKKPKRSSGNFRIAPAAAGAAGTSLLFSSPGVV